MTTVLVYGLAALGALLMLLAAVGIARMPDLLTRMQTASKASTLGAASILTAVAVDHPEIGVSVRASSICAFLFLTAPVAAHMIARAAHRSGVRFAPETRPDELAGRYEPATGALRGLEERGRPRSGSRTTESGTS